jgi:hypothetical protein
MTKSPVTQLENKNGNGMATTTIIMTEVWTTGDTTDPQSSLCFKNTQPKANKQYQHISSLK